MSQADPVQRQLQGLALLLQIQRQARSAEDRTALGFTMVNETRLLIPYRQAAIWINGPLSEVPAVSGVAITDSNAPYIVWLKQTAEALQALQAQAVVQFTGHDVPDHLAHSWSDWCAPYGLAMPLRSGEESLGMMLFFRDQIWQDSEIGLLQELMDAYAHAWQALRGKRFRWESLKQVQRRWLWLGLVLLWPVRISVLSPAEITPVNPTLIRAPLDGVVDTFFVQPNQPVASGDLLVRLENTDINNRLDVARKSLAVAEAEYRSNFQMAVLDNKNKSELAVLKSKIDQHIAETEFLEDQLARSEIHAPHAGVAIYSDPQDWLGKPVTTGEKLLQVADASITELTMELPVADLISLPDAAEVIMYLNSDPNNPLEAELYSVAYQSELTHENVLAYRLKARLIQQDAQPRIGLQGTAKIYGERVTLFYYMFRKPLAAFRQWIGL